MKSFLELIEEESKNDHHHVMTFGRMNPPTTGHLKLIDKVKEVAKKHNANHTVVVSHTQDSKKNPLSGTQKVKHLKRYSPDTHFEKSSKEHPSIFHHAEKLHKQGVSHLHVVVGSDRVKEFKDSLNKYNGKANKEGHVPYHFKKITVHSAGHRDPDAEGSEGMSGTKMREHAKNKNFGEFRKGVPGHVADHHAKELMKDTRKGMGLHEEVNRGQFKAIFVTGGPGSGKDIVIRESISEARIVELNLTQASDYLADKQKLSEKTNDFRRESIRNRGPLIINGPADASEKIAYIKEELEELGYETMMVFVNTTNEVSQERNSLLSRMMVESVRNDKWLKSQKNISQFNEMYSKFITFDNTGNLDSKEEDINDIYQFTEGFLDSKTINETAGDWLNRNNREAPVNRFTLLFKESNHVKKDSKSVQFQTISKYNPSLRAKGPADIKPDNSGSLVGDQDQIKGNTGPRKDIKGQGVTGGAWHAAYSESRQETNSQKESNFQQDKEKTKSIRKKTFNDVMSGSKNQGNGVGDSFDSRSGTSAGLGQVGYSEAIDDPGAADWGVSGNSTGGMNKEPMQTYGASRLTGVEIKKKKKIKEDHVKELEGDLKKLDKTNYTTINKLMMKISKRNEITGKDLHNDFKDKHGQTPDNWIKDKNAKI